MADGGTGDVRHTRLAADRQAGDGGAPTRSAARSGRGASLARRADAPVPADDRRARRRLEEGAPLMQTLEETPATALAETKIRPRPWMILASGPFRNLWAA